MAGSKHDLLTRAEVDAFAPRPLLVKWLTREAEQNPQQPLRVLDWGCGRGLLVLWLLEHGFDAYGVDIDPEPIGNGRPFFESMGYDAGERLQLLDGSAASRFPAQHFDFVLSDQTLEHVRDLDQVALEIARVSKSSGVGLHWFPAHRVVMEPHLHMPLVHWVPKGFFRFLLIRGMVAVGREPQWAELRDASSSERARVFYCYSIGKTFYRAPGQIRGVFLRHGFSIEIRSSHEATDDGSDGGLRTLRWRLQESLRVRFGEVLLISRRAGVPSSVSTT